MTKKSVSLLLTLIMMIALIPMGASAARVGDVVGYAQPTDIVAMINGYQLESFNVNGHTYIVAEDLRYYGFDVYFDSASRSLSINRNYNIGQIDPQRTNPNFWNAASTKKTKILYTDIVTYVNNEYVASSNINGKTIINFNELARFGAVNYDNSRREITLSLGGLNINPIYNFAIAFQADYDNEDWRCKASAKGDLLMLYFTSKTYMSKADINHYLATTAPTDKRDFQELLDMLQSKGLPVSSIYIESYNSNGVRFESYQLY
ncbi:MAG: hypothetical protein Q4G23_02850 [Clostridia bacterium]|nr:hypothetical protein [Clostridia bacterium]